LLEDGEHVEVTDNQNPETTAISYVTTIAEQPQSSMYILSTALFRTEHEIQ